MANKTFTYQVHLDTTQFKSQSGDMRRVVEAAFAPVNVSPFANIVKEIDQIKKNLQSLSKLDLSNSFTQFSTQLRQAQSEAKALESVLKSLSSTRGFQLPDVTPQIDQIRRQLESINPIDVTKPFNEIRNQISRLQSTPINLVANLDTKTVTTQATEIRQALQSAFSGIDRAGAPANSIITSLQLIKSNLDLIGKTDISRIFLDLNSQITQALTGLTAVESTIQNAFVVKGNPLTQSITPQIDAIKQQLESINQVDVTSSIDDIKAQLTELKQVLAGISLSSRFRTPPKFEDRINTLKRNLESLNDIVITIPNPVGNLKEWVKEARAEVAGLKTDLSNIQPKSSKGKKNAADDVVGASALKSEIESIGKLDITKPLVDFRNQINQAIAELAKLKTDLPTINATSQAQASSAISKTFTGLTDLGGPTMQKQVGIQVDMSQVKQQISAISNMDVSAPLDDLHRTAMTVQSDITKLQSDIGKLQQPKASMSLSDLTGGGGGDQPAAPKRGRAKKVTEDTTATQDVTTLENQVKEIKAKLEELSNIIATINGVNITDSAVIVEKVKGAKKSLEKIVELLNGLAGFDLAVDLSPLLAQVKKVNLDLTKIGQFSELAKLNPSGDMAQVQAKVEQIKAQLANVDNALKGLSGVTLGADISPLMESVKSMRRNILYLSNFAENLANIGTFADFTPLNTKVEQLRQSIIRVGQIVNGLNAAVPQGDLQDVVSKIVKVKDDLNAIGRAAAELVNAQIDNNAANNAANHVAKLDALKAPLTALAKSIGELSKIKVDKDLNNLVADLVKVQPSVVGLATAVSNISGINLSSNLSDFSSNVEQIKSNLLLIKQSVTDLVAFKFSVNANPLREQIEQLRAPLAEIAQSVSTLSGLTITANPEQIAGLVVKLNGLKQPLTDLGKAIGEFSVGVEFKGSIGGLSTKIQTASESLSIIAQSVNALSSISIPADPASLTNLVNAFNATKTPLQALGTLVQGLAGIKVEGDLATVTTQVSNIRDPLSRLSESINLLNGIALTSDISGLQTKIEQARLSLAAIGSSVSELSGFTVTGETGQIGQKFESLRLPLTEISQAMASLTNITITADPTQVSGLVTKLTALKQPITEIGKLIGEYAAIEVGKSISGLSTKLTSASEALAAIATSINALSTVQVPTDPTQISNLVTAFNTAKTPLQSLGTVVQELSNVKVDGNLSTLNSQLALVKEPLSNLGNSITQLSAINFSGDIGGLQVKVEQAKQSLSAIGTAISELSNFTITGSIDPLSQRIESVRKPLIDIAAAINDITAISLPTDTGRISEIAKDFKGLQKPIKDLDSTVTLLSGLTIANSSATTLSTQLNQAKLELANIATAINDIVAIVKPANAEAISGITTQYSQVVAPLKTLNKTITDLATIIITGDLANLSQNIVQARVELSSLSGALNTLSGLTAPQSITAIPGLFTPVKKPLTDLGKLLPELSALYITGDVANIATQITQARVELASLSSALTTLASTPNPPDAGELTQIVEKFRLTQKPIQDLGRLVTALSASAVSGNLEGLAAQLNNLKSPLADISSALNAIGNTAAIGKTDVINQLTNQLKGTQKGNSIKVDVPAVDLNLQAIPDSIYSNTNSIVTAIQAMTTTATQEATNSATAISSTLSTTQQQIAQAVQSSPVPNALGQLTSSIQQQIQSQSDAINQYQGVAQSIQQILAQKQQYNASAAGELLAGKIQSSIDFQSVKFIEDSEIDSILNKIRNSYKEMENLSKGAKQAENAVLNRSIAEFQVATSTRNKQLDDQIRYANNASAEKLANLKAQLNAEKELRAQSADPAGKANSDAKIKDLTEQIRAANEELAKELRKLDDNKAALDRRITDFNNIAKLQKTSLAAPGQSNPNAIANAQNDQARIEREQAQEIKAIQQQRIADLRQTTEQQSSELQKRIEKERATRTQEINMTRGALEEKKRLLNIEIQDVQRANQQLMAEAQANLSRIQGERSAATKPDRAKIAELKQAANEQVGVEREQTQAQIEELQRRVAATRGLYAEQLDAAKQQVTGLRQAYQQQINPLQQQMSTLQNATPIKSPFEQLLNVGKGFAAGYATVMGSKWILDAAVNMAEYDTKIRRARVATIELAGSSQKAAAAVGSIRSAAGGTVDRLGAMQIANQAMALGLASSGKEFERLVVAARGVALVSPVIHDVQSAITELALASANMSFRRLDQLGLSVTEVKDRIEQLKKTHGELNDNQLFYMASVDKLNEKYGELVNSSEAAATGLEKLKVAWNDLSTGGGKIGLSVDQLASDAATLLKLADVNLFNVQDVETTRTLVKDTMADLKQLRDNPLSAGLTSFLGWDKERLGASLKDLENAQNELDKAQQAVENGVPGAEQSLQRALQNAKDVANEINGWSWDSLDLGSFVDIVKQVNVSLFDTDNINLANEVLDKAIKDANQIKSDPFKVGGVNVSGLFGYTPDYMDNQIKLMEKARDTYNKLQTDVAIGVPGAADLLPDVTKMVAEIASSYNDFGTVDQSQIDALVAKYQQLNDVRDQYFEKQSNQKLSASQMEREAEAAKKLSTYMEEVSTSSEAVKALNAGGLTEYADELQKIITKKMEEGELSDDETKRLGDLIAASQRAGNVFQFQSEMVSLLGASYVESSKQAQSLIDMVLALNSGLASGKIDTAQYDATLAQIKTQVQGLAETRARDFANLLNQIDAGLTALLNKDGNSKFVNDQIEQLRKYKAELLTTGTLDEKGAAGATFAANTAQTQGFQPSADTTTQQVLAQSNEAYAALIAKQYELQAARESGILTEQMYAQAIASVNREMQNIEVNATSDTINSANELSTAILNLDAVSAGGLAGFDDLANQAATLQEQMYATGFATQEQVAQAEYYAQISSIAASETGFYAQAVGALGEQFFATNPAAATLLQQIIELQAAHATGAISSEIFAGKLSVLTGELVSVGAQAGLTASQIQAAFGNAMAMVAGLKAQFGGTMGFRVGAMQGAGLVAADRRNENERVRQEQIKSAKAAGKSIEQAAKASEKIWEDAAKKFKDTLEKIPGLFKTTDVTEADMAMAKGGGYIDKVDEYIRRLRDEVLNGKDWKNVSIGDARAGLQAAGLDASGNDKAVLAKFEEAWNNHSLWAAVENIDKFVNMDAIKYQQNLQELVKKGEENLLKRLGKTVETATGTYVVEPGQEDKIKKDAEEAAAEAMKGGGGGGGSAGTVEAVKATFADTTWMNGALQVTVEQAKAALAKIGVDVAGKTEDQILKLFDQKVATGEIFAVTENTNLIDQSVIQQQKEAEQRAKQGQENLQNAIYGKANATIEQFNGWVDQWTSGQTQQQPAQGPTTNPTIIPGATNVKTNGNITTGDVELNATFKTPEKPIEVDATIKGLTVPPESIQALKDSIGTLIIPVSILANTGETIASAIGTELQAEQEKLKGQGTAIAQMLGLGISSYNFTTTDASGNAIGSIGDDLVQKINEQISAKQNMFYASGILIASNIKNGIAGYSFASDDGNGNVTTLADDLIATITNQFSEKTDTFKSNGGTVASAIASGFIEYDYAANKIDMGEAVFNAIGGQLQARLDQFKGQGSGIAQIMSESFIASLAPKPQAQGQEQQNQGVADGAGSLFSMEFINQQNQKLSADMVENLRTQFTAGSITDTLIAMGDGIASFIGFGMEDHQFGGIADGVVADLQTAFGTEETYSRLFDIGGSAMDAILAGAADRMKRSPIGDVIVNGIAQKVTETVTEGLK